MTAYIVLTGKELTRKWVFLVTVILTVLFIGFYAYGLSQIAPNLKASLTDLARNYVSGLQRCKVIICGRMFTANSGTEFREGVRVMAEIRAGWKDGVKTRLVTEWFGRFGRMAAQLLHFAYRQALCCLFPLAIFGTLLLSRLITIPYLHRYDFILLVLLLVQAAMVWSGLETRDELKVICVFHLTGLLLELYKTHMGSWAYPEAAWSKMFGVPLYSGFMYASVASYLCQAWRRLELRLTGWPRAGVTVTLSAAIYLNFFTHHFVPDARWMLTGLVFAVFWRTHAEFRVRSVSYRMPLTVSFLLIGFFIWLAENIATFFGAWQYPNQEEAWHLVGLGKISSWYLLVIISIVLVAQLKHVKAGLRKGEA